MSRSGILAAALFMAVTTSSCKKEEPAPPPPAPAIKIDKGVDLATKTVFIGALNDESGPAAALGKPFAVGKRLLVRQVNAGQSGILPEGWKIELVERDCAYDPDAAAKAYAELRGVRAPRVGQDRLELRPDLVQAVVAILERVLEGPAVRPDDLIEELIGLVDGGGVKLAGLRFSQVQDHVGAELSNRHSTAQRICSFADSQDHPERDICVARC